MVCRVPALPVRRRPTAVQYVLRPEVRQTSVHRRRPAIRLQQVARPHVRAPFHPHVVIHPVRAQGLRRARPFQHHLLRTRVQAVQVVHIHQTATLYHPQRQRLQHTLHDLLRCNRLAVLVVKVVAANIQLIQQPRLSLRTCRPLRPLRPGRNRHQPGRYVTVVYLHARQTRGLQRTLQYRPQALHLVPVQFLACQHTEVRKCQTHRVPPRALIRFLVQLRVKRPPPVQRTRAVHVQPNRARLHRIQIHVCPVTRANQLQRRRTALYHLLLRPLLPFNQQRLVIRERQLPHRGKSSFRIFVDLHPPQRAVRPRELTRISLVHHISMPFKLFSNRFVALAPIGPRGHPVVKSRSTP